MQLIILGAKLARMLILKLDIMTLKKICLLNNMNKKLLSNSI